MERLGNGTTWVKSDDDFKANSEAQTHFPMLPIEAEYLIKLEELKLAVVTTPTMNIEDVKRAYQQIHILYKFVE